MYEEQEDSMSSLKEIQALQLQSEKVFDYFEEICAIPHGSRNTKAICDYLVAFDGFEFECVDKGFEDNEEIEVVLRPEDLDIVDPGQAKIRGIVRNITFKGVHYEILIETELRTYMVHTTDYAEVGREVGLKFGPEDIHVMCKMGSY